jgi:putative copper export protein
VRRLAGLTPRLAWAAVPLWFPIGGAAGGVLGLVIAGPPRDLLIGAVHLLSAGMWAGGIMVMASLRPPGGWAGTEGRELVERFARVALIAFGVTALTGLIQATDRLHDLSDLWTTTYGQVLSLKAAGVLAMLPLSLAWRRGLPTARLDRAAALLVVALTAVLAAFPAQA